MNKKKYVFKSSIITKYLGIKKKTWNLYKAIQGNIDFPSILPKDLNKKSVTQAITSKVTEYDTKITQNSMYEIIEKHIIWNYYIYLFRAVIAHGNNCLCIFDAFVSFLEWWNLF